MNVTKEKLENSKVKLEITVDPETFEKGMQKSYIKNRKSIAVPGFRKGKVPRKVIENYYGEAIFYEDAINDIFPDVYKNAVDDNDIVPVGDPAVDLVQIGDGKDLILAVEVAVKPDVELGQYTGIEVQKVEYKVSDDEVDHQLEHIQEDNARWLAIEDRNVQNDDRVSLDFAGTIDGKEFPGGTSKNYSLIIGSGQFIPGFEEQLVGMEPNEEKDITVKFPEDYHAEDLKGKEAAFHVKINEIKEKELPKLDDEFAKDVSDFDTLDEYKEDLKQKLLKDAKENSKAEMENELLQKIADNAIVEIPDVMVEKEIDNIVQDFNMRLSYSGINLENYLKMANTSLKDFREQYKDNAYNRVKTQLVLESISKAEGIKATDEDLDNEYTKLAEQYKSSVEEIKKSFGNNVDYLESNVVIQKTVDKLMAEADFVDKVEKMEDSENNSSEESKESEKNEVKEEKEETQN